jgi:hypothetical protein
VNVERELKNMSNVSKILNVIIDKNGKQYFVNSLSDLDSHFKDKACLATYRLIHVQRATPPIQSKTEKG